MERLCEVGLDRLRTQVSSRLASKCHRRACRQQSLKASSFEDAAARFLISISIMHLFSFVSFENVSLFPALCFGPAMTSRMTARGGSHQHHQETDDVLSHRGTAKVSSGLCSLDFCDLCRPAISREAAVRKTRTKRSLRSK